MKTFLGMLLGAYLGLMVGSAASVVGKPTNCPQVYGPDAPLGVFILLAIPAILGALMGSEK